MRPRIAVFLSFILVLGGLSIAFYGGDEATAVNIIEEGNYCKILSNDGIYLYKEGYPLLPYKVKTYTFPLGTKINGVNVLPKNIEKMKLSKKILPAPPAIPLNMESFKYEIKEGSIYNEDIFYPEKWYDYELHAGMKDGKRIIFLSVYLYPYRYNPVKNKLLCSTDFEVEVDYKLPPTQNVKGEEYDFLIISPSAWKDELQVLKEHKESYGIRTIIQDTTEIYSTYKGRDEAEKIKYAIKDAIETWGIKYVMLVGDADYIPARFSYIPSEPYETYFPSDLYYADIYFPDGSFCSWDSNENNKFGEYQYQGQTDDVDLAPDVAIGRIACSSESELNTVINKIIKYEKNTFGADWFGNILACGGDTFIPADGDNTGVYEGEYLNSLVINTMSDFNAIKLWASLGNLSASTIKDKINSGVGFVDFSGHGNRLKWATHPPLGGKYDWIEYRMAHISQLSNGDKLPVVVIDACSCGRFDSGDCFAWKFVEKSGGGAIASLASSGIGYGTYGRHTRFLGWMEVYFFKYYKQGNEIIGDIWVNSINGYVNFFHTDMADVKTAEEWTLFGDPTLKIGGYESEEAVIYIDKPLDGYLYLANRQIMPTLFGKTIIIGKINVEVSAYNVEKVEFYINNELKYTDDSEPYEWLWDELAIGKRTLKVVGYGNENVEKEKSFFIINI